MEDAIFIQRSRLGRTLFTLRADRLAITGRLSSTEFGLDRLRGDVERRKWRSYAAIEISIVLAGLCVWLVRHLAWLPDGLYFGAVMFGWMFATIFLVAGLRFVFPLEAARFYTLDGKPAFDIVKERNQAGECEEFIQAIQRAIKVCHENA